MKGKSNHFRQIGYSNVVIIIYWQGLLFDSKIEPV